MQRHRAALVVEAAVPAAEVAGGRRRRVGVGVRRRDGRRRGARRAPAPAPGSRAAPARRRPLILSRRFAERTARSRAGSGACSRDGPDLADAALTHPGAERRRRGAADRHGQRRAVLELRRRPRTRAGSGSARAPGSGPARRGPRSAPGAAPPRRLAGDDRATSASAIAIVDGGILPMRPRWLPPGRGRVRSAAAQQAPDRAHHLLGALLAIAVAGADDAVAGVIVEHARARPCRAPPARRRPGSGCRCSSAPRRPSARSRRPGPRSGAAA